MPAVDVRELSRILQPAVGRHPRLGTLLAILLASRLLIGWLLRRLSRRVRLNHAHELLPGPVGRTLQATARDRRQKRDHAKERQHRAAPTPFRRAGAGSSTC